MADAFEYDLFLNHSAKDKAVVRPPAERLRKDGLEHGRSEILHSSFFLSQRAPWRSSFTPTGDRQSHEYEAF